MRSATPSDDADLTARARIRDAALARFAADGFGAPLRAIAADAGVSPALVIHHFGSKDGLRHACDEQVRRIVAEGKEPVYGAPGGHPDRADMFALLADVERYGVPTLYLLRVFQAGGDLARELVDDMVELTRTTLADGVASGAVRPSRDEDARARYLVMLTLGALVVDQALHPADPGDTGGFIRGYMARYALPSAEVFTEGLLLDATMLDAVAATWPAPTDPTPTDPPRTRT
ncbi:TetR/AcrR family transcriptional regulator [Cellulomonas citrea]|uniref:TetR/AcrR family transcriptional regulator n=1 Tax=Cellulomonas citrea TaxID=1909423 RepID=UPI001F1BE431|nr:TetR family transcriptional regulator [Cellulomonas citrea]